MEMDQKCPQKYIVILSLSVCQFTTKSKHSENRRTFMTTLCVSNKLLDEGKMGNTVFRGLREAAVPPSFSAQWPTSR